MCENMHPTFVQVDPNLHFGCKYVQLVPNLQAGNALQKRKMYYNI